MKEQALRTNLRNITNKAREEKNKAEEEKERLNTNKAIDYFITACRKRAEQGICELKTTALVHQRKENAYFYQTETGGDGFTIDRLDLVIEELKENGLTVSFKHFNSGYCPLTIGWA